MPRPEPRIFRVVYGGVCEAWVEVQHNTITRVLSATAHDLIGHSVTELPAPRYYEAKLMAGEEVPGAVQQWR